MYLLKIEYSSDFTDCLTQGYEFQTSLAQRCDRAQKRRLNIESDLNFDKEISLNWPVIPYEETVYHYLAAYQAGAIWKLPHPCACCVHTQHGAQTEAISLDDPESLYQDLNLELLRKLSSSCPPFTPPPIPQFSDLLLHSSGFSFNVVDGCNLLYLCKECVSQLRSNKMPTFALANNL